MMFSLLLLYGAFLCAIFSAILARQKNRDVLGWFFCGLLFGPFGLLVAAMPPLPMDIGFTKQTGVPNGGEPKETGNGKRENRRVENRESQKTSKAGLYVMWTLVGALVFLIFLAAA